MLTSEIMHLPMEVECGGCGGREEALEHSQLHAVVRDVVATTEQLDGLGLRGHVIPISMIPMVSQIILLRWPLHHQKIRVSLTLIFWLLCVHTLCAYVMKII